MRKFAPLLLGLLISAAILWFLASNLDFEALAREIKRVNLLYLPLLLIIFLLSIWIRAYRWRYLLPGRFELSTFELFRATSIGYFASFILPLRAGEVIRPLVLSRRTDVRFGLGLASVLTERVFDVLTTLAIFWLCLSQIQQAPQWVYFGAQALGVVSLAILLVMLMSYLRPELVLSITHWFTSTLLPRRFEHIRSAVDALAEEFIEGLRAIESIKELVLVLLWSIVLWLLVGGYYQLAMWSMGEFTFNPWLGLTVSTLIALAIAVPSAPGFIGPFQAGCVLALEGVFGYSREFSVGYSLIHHAFQILAVLALGFILLQQMGVSLFKLQAESEAKSA